MPIKQNNPIIGQLRNGTPEDSYIHYTTWAGKVVNGYLQLPEIPVNTSHVYVTAVATPYEAEQYYETFTNDSVVIGRYEYRVDYINGVVKFHEDANGRILTFDFKGRGIQYIPASRVYTKNEGETVTETLGDIIDSGAEAIEAYGSIGGAITEANNVKSGLDGSISTANTARTNLNNTISSANSARPSLDFTVGNANTSRTNLEGSIGVANSTKEALDQSIANGSIDTINDEIDIINANVSGVYTILGAQSEDINKLKNDIETSNTSTPVEATSSIISLPYNVRNAQFSEVTLLGNTVDGVSTFPAIRETSVGKNLFDKSSNITKDRYVDWSNGNLISSSVYDTTDFIKIIGGTSYYKTKLRSCAFYDINKNYISGVSDVSDKVIAPPINAVYFRSHFYKEDINDVMLHKGTQATTYEEYKESISYVYATDENGNVIELHSLDNGTKDEYCDT